MSDLLKLPGKGAGEDAARRPIGVFDSGLGGLTIVREIRRRMPAESIVYFGDIARLPYGTKSKEQILRFSVQNTLFLLSHKVKAVVVACNSSASTSYAFLKRNFNVPVVDVVEPVMDAAVASTRTKRIGVLGTAATIESGTYRKGLLRRDRGLKIFSQACPLFVPFVEEGALQGSLVMQLIHQYLAPLTARKPDTLILGCTHYPLLKKAISKSVGNKIRLVDSMVPATQRLEAILDDKRLRNPSGRKGKLRIYVSDKPRNFIKVGERFLGEKLKHVEVVRDA